MLHSMSQHFPRPTLLTRAMSVARVAKPPLLSQGSPTRADSLAKVAVDRIGTAG